jgi:hypothetical protein
MTYGPTLPDDIRSQHRITAHAADEAPEAFGRDCLHWRPDGRRQWRK